MRGIAIGNIHTGDTLGLMMTGIEYPNPKRKISTFDIPSIDGVIDLTDAISNVPKYQNDFLLASFFVEGKHNSLVRLERIVIQEFQGKKEKVISDDFPENYYLGRCDVTTERHRGYMLIDIEIDCQPYRYDITSSVEDWYWDIFNFETGVIREYRDIVVNGTVNILVIGSGMPAFPIIHTTEVVSLLIDGTDYTLQKGITKLYDELLMDKEYTFSFTGNAVISIEIRGGSL